MGQAIQGDPGRTIDTPRTTSHGPIIQRSSTHESWGHDQRIWSIGGQREHSFLWSDSSMVPSQQLWLGKAGRWFWKVSIGEIMSGAKGDRNSEHGASCVQSVDGGDQRRGQHPILWQVHYGCCEARITSWCSQSWEWTEEWHRDVHLRELYSWRSRTLNMSSMPYWDSEHPIHLH